MNALIIEDEVVAQRSLERLLRRSFPDVEIIGRVASVRAAVRFLKEQEPDLIFMDVELADGTCFDIFMQVGIHAPVIMTTAFDRYAIQAFETGSIDYLLKPVDLADLRRAMARVLLQHRSADAQRLLSALSETVGSGEMSAQGRYLVKVGDRIYPIRLDDIAFFYAERKCTYLVTRSGLRYLVDPSLDVLTAQLDPVRFFRANRGCIVSRSSIQAVEPLPGGRYRLRTDPAFPSGSDPAAPSGIEVSRGRADDFYLWQKNA